MSKAARSSMKEKLVYQVESDILQHSQFRKLSLRTDPSYFTGRAGIVRVITVIVAMTSVGFMTQGIHAEVLDPDNRDNREKIPMMRSANFSGYEASNYTYLSIAFGGVTIAIALFFIGLLFFFQEVRCDLIWERINQKAQVLACIASVSAAFCDVMSIQTIQEVNCNTIRCKEEIHNTKNLKFEEPYFPPYFQEHYLSFVGFLINAMLFSIASRIWLRNED